MGEWDHIYDAVIVGSGGGGMVAALTCRSRGLDVLVVEKTDLIGGSTALSGGGMWIPNNPLMRSEGVPDSDDEALEYFGAVLGDGGPASSLERRRSFVRNGPLMVQLLMDLGVRLARNDGWPDYYSDAPGASVRGRSVEGVPYDLRKNLGDSDRLLRPGMSVHLGIPGTMDELALMSHWNRSVRNVAVAGRVIARTIAAKVRRQNVVCGGGSLIAQLLKAAIDREIPIWVETPLQELVFEDGRVCGVVVERAGNRVRVGARHGIVLAAGGFSRNRAMREQYFGDPVMADRTRAAPGDTGETLQMAVALGAATANLDTAIWLPAQVMPDGTSPSYSPMQSSSYSRARHRPGTMIVDSSGRRFSNETASYMEVGQRMLDRNRDVPAIPSWLIFDDRYRRRYTFGWIPGRLPEQWIRDGFVKRADTLRDLARQCGIDPHGLEANVHNFNRAAHRGLDPEFHRGDSAYDRFLGDRAHRPNPSIAPLEKKPFYATAVYPSDIGTFGGLLTDEQARVLDVEGHPISGVYGTGTVTASVMGRSYLGPGASIGPTCTFGFVAANAIADRAGATSARS